MKDHILLSEVAKKIRDKNFERVLKYEKKITDFVDTLREEANNEEKQDVAIVLNYYIRAWNDMICMSVNNWIARTAISRVDDYLSQASSFKDHLQED